MHRKKIFISAYSCEPDRGSEPGVGWNWVKEMSKYFDLWIITRKNNRKSIIDKMENHKMKNIHFLFYDPHFFLLAIKKLIGVHLFYIFWQWGANIKIKNAMKDNNIKIFHHLTFGNYMLPVSSFGQKNHFIWGPIGGGNFIPPDFCRQLTIKEKINEFFRRFFIRNFNIGVKNRAKNASLILCKDNMTLKRIPFKYRHKAFIFTDVAVKSKNILNKDLYNKKIKFFSVGTMVPFRGFDILIEAFAKAKVINPNIELEIVGDGINFSKLKLLVENYNLSDSIFLPGNTNLEVYHRKLANCDVVINSCLKEGGVTVSFDSVAYEKPLICVDSGGYTNKFIGSAIILPMSERDILIDSMANAIIKMSNKDFRKKILNNHSKLKDRLSWEAKGKEIFKLITKKMIINN